MKQKFLTIINAVLMVAVLSAADVEAQGFNQETFFTPGTGYGVEASANDESTREDRTTGGRIQRAPLEPGNPNLLITVDVPAFLVTLWQGDKEVVTYNVGVGQKDYPILIGTRTAEQVIFNPDWYPPDSDWVRESGIKPGTRITAKDPRNPIGKIKIPLGGGYLLHEAKGVGDLGSLVSHGCVRVLRRDLFDLSRKLIAAHNLEVSDKTIAQAQADKKQRIIKLAEAIEVDINYDTMVVERGILHIYPDVYEYKKNTVERLRAELEKNDVDASKLSDATLQKMLGRAVAKKQYVVSLADIRAGKELSRGRILPVVGSTAAAPTRARVVKRARRA